MASDFTDPERHLAEVAPRHVSALLAATADLALVIDGGDIIRDVAHNLDAAAGGVVPTWRDMPVEDVVRAASRPVLKRALQGARTSGRALRFEVCHPMGNGRELPVQYSALDIGPDGRLMLVGRDMRLIGELKARRLADQQLLERTVKDQRLAEAQYRLLFETVADALVIVDAASGKVREANPRARSLLGASTRDPRGRKLHQLFDKAAQAGVRAMLAETVALGRPGSLAVQTAGGETISLASDLFRADQLMLVMVRIAPGEPQAEAVAGEGGLASLVRNAAEAVVLTDHDWNVLWGNDAFLSMADIPLAAHAMGRTFSDFLQWNDVEREMLQKSLQRFGRVQPFSATIRGANGRTTEVELSAVSLPEVNPPGYGFVLRALPGSAGNPSRANSELARTAESLVEMIGRVPMKDLVRDTTDMVERMCIEAALKLTGNNRASASRVLGLSRQALYLKMNRFGITDAE